MKGPGSHAETQDGCADDKETHPRTGLQVGGLGDVGPLTGFFNDQDPVRSDFRDVPKARQEVLDGCQGQQDSCEQREVDDLSAAPRKQRCRDAHCRGGPERPDSILAVGGRGPENPLGIQAKNQGWQTGGQGCDQGTAAEQGAGDDPFGASGGTWKPWLFFPLGHPWNIAGNFFIRKAVSTVLFASRALPPGPGLCVELAWGQKMHASGVAWIATV